jgi:hypothetical protein
VEASEPPAAGRSSALAAGLQNESVDSAAVTFEGEGDVAARPKKRTWVSASSSFIAYWPFG